MNIIDMILGAKLFGSGGGSQPSGTKEISITENGTTTEDVKAYASAEITVNVSGGGADLAALDVYMADWISAPPTITKGALNALTRRIYGN